MATTYKLTYFNIRARAEPTRIVFAYAGVDYEDVRIDWGNRTEKWLPFRDSGKCPFGQIPLLEVDNVTLCQSMTILRFVAGRHGLVPDNDLQHAVADMFADGVYEIENEHVRVFIEKDPEKQKAGMKEFLEKKIPKYCKNLEKILERNPKEEVFCVGNKLSYADIACFSYFNSYIGGGELAVPAVLKSFPRLTALYEKVRDEPKIKAWLKKRPQSAL